jgi:hypothetical protein
MKKPTRKPAKKAAEKSAGRKTPRAKASAGRKSPRATKTPAIAKKTEDASRLIDARIRELGDWRGKTLARVRQLIHEVDPVVVEEWKWMGTPVWEHEGIICTGETYKSVVKLTFAKGARLEDPSGLFNSSLEGNIRRAIDIHETDEINEAALKDLVRSAIVLNLKNPPRRR